jgi:diaminopimelate epimerase
VRFVHEKGLSHKRCIRVQTMKGMIEPTLEDDGNVTVDMGAPQFAPEQVPIDVTGLLAAQYPYAWRFPIDEALRTKMTEDGQFKGINGMSELIVSAISMGNPHAVQVVNEVAHAPVGVLGSWVEAHPAFPQRVNAGFMQMVSRTAIKLRVFERSVGETLACGSGACAAVVAGITRGLLDEVVTVTTRGGDLRIRWAGVGQPVMMTGSATTVFEGVVDVPDL